MMAGQKPDPVYGIRAKQRSVHNNYFTLPVLFLMISNHYAMTYRHAHAWAVLAVIMAAGVLIRHFFNLRHKGRIEWKYPVAGVALLLGLAVAIAPKAPVQAKAAAGLDEAARFAQVRTIIDQRCVSCHAQQPTQAGFATAPSGVMLHTPELVSQNALRIYQQGKAMDPVTAIDVSRLSYSVGAMQSENDYYRYAQAANTKGFPGEAKAVLDAGFAAGVISKASPTFGPLYASVSTKAQGDKASLAAASKTALAAPAAKQAVVIGDAYYGYGDYAQAISLYRAALTKTGVDKDLVNLHLGMALAKSGDKAGAKAALEAVAGAQADTAKLWLTYLALAA